MAYTDDWESLMNGVFGAGGKLKFGGAQPQPEKPQPEKPAGSGLPDLNAALLEQQKQRIAEAAERPAEGAGCRGADGAGGQPPDAAGYGSGRPAG